MAHHPRLSEFVDSAAAEYLREIGRPALYPQWVAEFYADFGVGEVYPQVDLVRFFALVDKALAKAVDRADKQARLQVERIARRSRPSRRR